MKEPFYKLYIVDDDVDFCEALMSLAESVRVISKAFHSALDFLEAYNATWCGCLLLDTVMPIMDGLQLQKKLTEMGNQMPIIMLSGHNNIPMAVAALKAGAFDFVVKPFNAQTLIERIQNAFTLNDTKNFSQIVAQRYQQLTPRQQEILTKIASGKTNKVIALELNISLKTVELHRSHIMQKMAAKNAADLFKAYFSLDKSLFYSIK